MGMLGGLGRGGREGELVSHINLQKTSTAVSTGFKNFKRRGKNLSYRSKLLLSKAHVLASHVNEARGV